MMRYIKMFLTHVQTALHCSNCQKSPISMFFWWFSERDEKQLRCLFQPQMLHSDAQCFFQPLKKRALPPSSSVSLPSKLHIKATISGVGNTVCFLGWITTDLFLIGHTCHRIENGGGLHNNSNPGSGNSILLGTGASPPVSGNSILNTNTMKKIWKGIFFLGHTAILCPMTRIPFGKIPFSALALRRLTNLTQSAWSNTNIFYNEKSDFVVVQLGGGVHC